MKQEVRRYPDLEALSEAAAEFICTEAQECQEARGLFTLVLAGGKTPELLYQNLVQPSFNVRMPWSHTHFFWGDERCVSPDHPDSNFGMVSRALISKVPIPPQNVHRIEAENGTPGEAAKAYERTLRRFFGPAGNGNSTPSSSLQEQRFPSFDLVMLGVGKDGHTASLFPGDPVVEEQERWVAAVPNPRGSPPVPRVTLTLPVINRAKCVLFLVSGAEKRDVVRLVINDPQAPSRFYPAARVRPQGRLVWLLDEEAS